MLRIGELSRRLGVSDHLLRAWERRYGLLRPVRTAGGFRLYSEADLRRVQRMQQHLGQGLSAAEAARAAIDDEPGDGPAPGPTAGPAAEPGTTAAVPGARALATALDRYDEPAAQAVLDRLLTTLTVETVIREVLIPYLHELGERWQRGEVSVAQEHYASHVVRGRLVSLARGWGHGHGPGALLACLPGELHDIGLLGFGVVLHRNGWRISYLGADTPLADLIRTASARRPELVVVTGTVPELFAGQTVELARLAGAAPLAIAGAGATGAVAGAVGARLLVDDPVTAAERLPVPDRRTPGQPGPMSGTSGLPLRG
jgi:DNA-binding transcriptional MerR regulator